MVGRRKLYITAALIVTVAAFLAAWLNRPLKVIPAKLEHDVPVQVYGLGTLEAHTISKIGFKISGTLISLEADQGDRVKKGQVLARLDSAEQESRVLKAEANVLKSKAAILVAKAKEEKARYDLKHKENLHERRQVLVQKGATSTEEVEEKRTGADLARAELNLAAGERIAAEAALKDAEAQLSFEKVLLSQHTLVAPYDGQIVSRNKELGSVQSSNEPLFILIDPRTIWARVYIDEEMAGGLRIGQNAEIRLRSAKGKVLAGQIARIDIESDRASEERCVHVAFENPPDDYHLGEQTEALIKIASLGSSWFVPASEIKDISGASGQVWSIRDGKLDLYKVTLGYRLLDGRYEISGLDPECRPVIKVPSSVQKGRKAVLLEENRP